MPRVALSCTTQRQATTQWQQGRSLVPLPALSWLVLLMLMTVVQLPFGSPTQPKPPGRSEPDGPAGQAFSPWLAFIVSWSMSVCSSVGDGYGGYAAARRAVPATASGRR